MYRILTLVLLAVGIFTGCSSVRDARGPSEICEVHHAFMHAVEVPGPKAAVQLDPAYVQAGVRYFPHCYPEYQPDRRHRVVIYLCDECVRLQNDWKRQH